MTATITITTDHETRTHLKLKNNPIYVAECLRILFYTLLNAES